MNAREEAMLDAVKAVYDDLTDLLGEWELPQAVSVNINEQRVKLRDVLDLYRHQAGRMSAPYAERTLPSCALPGLSAVLAPGGK
jgi:hypothetical protein